MFTGSLFLYKEEDRVSHEELKQLDTRRTAIEEVLKGVLENLKTEENKNERKELQNQLSKLGNALHEIKKAREKLHEDYKVIVTEHALLRYFERVLGFDLNEIKSQIVPEKTVEQIRTCQSGVFPVNNFKLRVKKGIVITLVRD